MATIIAVANQKGGVGKTTSAMNLGAALQQMGRRVLLVDLDPQGSLTVALGFNPDSLEQTVYSVLKYVNEVGDIETLAELPIQKTTEGLNLVPSNIELSKAELELLLKPGGYTALRDALRPAKAAYDYIFVDCPPSLGILTANALSAADQVIIPLQADFLALKGVYLLLDTISEIRRKVNRQLTIGGVFITMADTRLTHTKEMIATAQQVLSGKIRVFETIVRMNAPVKEAPIVGQSILTYDPTSTGAVSYRQLAKELVS